VEPPHTYIRETSASVVHHADYLGRRENHALCGAIVESPTTLADSDDTTLCPDCDAKLIVYHLQWWREKAEAATAELETLRARYGELEAPAPPIPDPDHVDSEPATFLDRARRELTELCRQCDGAVPYFRLKNAMQAFSDKLDTHERVLLAEEIGADGSLIRWSTTQIEILGWQVTNSPVHEEAEAMWETWHQDSYPVSKRVGKRRFGRSR
jgi:hypothetical protein